MRPNWPPCCAPSSAATTATRAGNCGAGAAALRLGRMEVVVRGRPVPLTPKEYGILELLFMRRGVVHSKPAIVNQVYGAEEGPALRTLDVIVCKLRKKLAACGAPDLVATVWGSGLILNELPEPATAEGGAEAGPGGVINWRRIAFALAMLMPLHASALEVTWQACAQAGVLAERQWGIPDGLLLAVGRVESGRTGPDGATVAWPWTIDANGTGRTLADRAEAVTTGARAAQRRHDLDRRRLLPGQSAATSGRLRLAGGGVRSGCQRHLCRPLPARAV